jgi:hypothetical protein
MVMLCNLVSINRNCAVGALMIPSMKLANDSSACGRANVRDRTCDFALTVQSHVEFLDTCIILELYMNSVGLVMKRKDLGT